MLSVRYDSEEIIVTLNFYQIASLCATHGFNREDNLHSDITILGRLVIFGRCELQFRLFGEALEYSRWLLASHRPQQVCSLPATLLLLLYCPSARPGDNLQRHPNFLKSEPRSVNHLFMGIFLGFRGAHLRFVKILVPEISKSVVLDHNPRARRFRRPGFVQNWPVRLNRSWNRLHCDSTAPDPIGAPRARP